jgi:hypothetical protein
MPTTVSEWNNYARLELEASVDLSAAGAVSATRGDGVSVEKNGVGLYEITVANPQGHILNEVLGSSCTVRDAAVGTVKDCGIKSVTQVAATGAFLIIARTVDAAGADVNEATNALTLDVRAVIRTRSMGNPL